MTDLRPALLEAAEATVRARIGLRAVLMALELLARDWADRALPVPDGLEARVAGEAIAGLIDGGEACAVLRPDLAREVEHWAAVPSSEWIEATEDDPGPWEVRQLALGALRRCPIVDGLASASGALHELEDIRRRQAALRHSRGAIQRLLDGRDDSAVDELRSAARALGAEARGDVWRAVAESADRGERLQRAPGCRRADWKSCGVAGRRRVARSA